MRKDVQTTSDELLLLQIAQGDSKAFGLLYDKYWDKAFSEAYTRLKDTDQAKDIVQDTFINIWVRRDSLQIENFPAYLNACVRNRVFNLVSRHPRHIYFDQLQSIPSVFNGPDASLISKELEASYDLLIQKLPAKRQLIYRLRFQENLTTRAIAENLQLSTKTVHNQLKKAVEQLKLSISHLLSVIFILSNFI